MQAARFECGGLPWIDPDIGRFSHTHHTIDMGVVMKFDKSGGVAAGFDEQALFFTGIFKLHKCRAHRHAGNAGAGKCGFNVDICSGKEAACVANGDKK